MAANLLSVTWQDAFGNKGTLSYNIGSAYPAGNADLVAFMTALQNMSQSKMVEAYLATKLDLSGIQRANPITSGSFDGVGDQAILQADKVDFTGKVRFSVPAPVNELFRTSGSYALAEIDPAASLVTALVAAGITEPVLVSADETALAFQKGWRRGQKHS